MLKKKLFRDLKQNLSQFFVIFLMVLLSVMVFAGVHAYMDGMRVSADEIYKEYNLADMWLVSEGFSEDDLNTVRSDTNVAAADRMLTLQVTPDGMDDATLELNVIESNDVCRMYVFDGAPFDKDSKDGIWLDKEFAEARGLGVGDTLSLSYEAYEVTATIAGLVETPDHAYSIKDSTEIFPDHNTFGYAYLSKAALPGLIQAFIPFPTVLIDLNDPSQFQETKNRLQSALPKILAVTGRDELASYAGYQSEVEEGETYSFVFTALFLFIAILSVITTMNRFIKKERTQIGTLKALGYRRSRIVRHYISYNFVLSIAASVLGIIAGLLFIGRFFLNMEMEYFEMPEAHTVILPIVYIVTACCIAVIVLITWLSCRKILNEPASQALRTEVPTVRNTNFTLTTRGIFRKLSTVTKWNLRDIGRNKGRSVAGIVGIMGCTILVVTALGMFDTISHYLDWQFTELHRYQSYVVVADNCTDKQLDDLIGQYGEETSQTLALEVAAGAGKDTVSQADTGARENTKAQADTEAPTETSTQMMLVTDATDSLHFTGHDGSPIELKDDGVYITEKLSKTLGLKIGDEFSWHVYGDDTWYTSPITGTYRDPQDQRFTCTKEYLESIEKEYRPDTIYSMEELDRTQVPDGAEVIQNKSGLESGVRSMLSRITSVIYLFIGFAALLAVVILYNLGILSYSEKQYQFATLRVLGYRTSNLRRIFNQQGRILSLVAILLGLPAGYWTISYIFGAALGDSYDFPAYVRPVTYLIAGASIFIVAVLVNDLMSRKIHKIDMVSSLKANE